MGFLQSLPIFRVTCISQYFFLRYNKTAGVQLISMIFKCHIPLLFFFTGRVAKHFSSVDLAKKKVIST